MATGQVKSVSVVFQAFTDKFEKATQRAGNQMTSFAKRAAGIVAGFVAGRAAVGAFTKQMSNLDRLGKLSDRLDIDPNTLRGMELAASQLGTNFSQVEKGIQRMSRTIGEAREGITTGTTALKDLGLTAADFSGMGVEQQYKMIADRIASIEDPSRKAAVAFRIFGRSGQEMLNMLNLGAKGLEEFSKEAEKLGGPITREDIRRVEEANDAIDKMGKAWGGIIQQLAIQMAPTLTDMATEIKNMIVWVRELGKTWRTVQLGVEDVLSDLFFEGKGKDILLDEAQPFKAKTKKEDLVFTPPEIKKVAAVSLKSFTDAAGFQSSKAFDILNPNRPGSVAHQNKMANERTADAVEKIADSDGVSLVRKDIGGN